MNFKRFFTRTKNGLNEGSKKESKLNKLLDKDGFYIIMFLCVCIVGASAVWVAKTNIDRLATEDIDKGEIASDESQIGDLAENEINDQINDIIIVDSEEDSEDQEASVEQIAQNSLEAQDDNVVEEKGKILVEDNPEPQIVITKAPKKTEIKVEESIPVTSEAITKQVMSWPVDGELGMGYAVETLAYSKTLEHFTTHHGIDILAEEKTPVKAAMDGEVVEILTDSRLGITITIAHEDNLLTRYSNLCTEAMVEVGDMVAEGQTISGIGSSSIFEAEEGPHLHFEVLMDGSNVDPMEYLAEN